MKKRNSMNNDIPCAVMSDLRKYENEMEEADENQELLEFEVRLTFDTVVRAYDKHDAQERICDSKHAVLVDESIADLNGIDFE
tara:strand:+ start:123 stop:371 length:249 start_codon:yes stop_codon:yes gene_type:complete